MKNVIFSILKRVIAPLLIAIIVGVLITYSFVLFHNFELSLSDNQIIKSSQLFFYNCWLFGNFLLVIFYVGLLITLLQFSICEL